MREITFTPLNLTFDYKFYSTVIKLMWVFCRDRGDATEHVQSERHTCSLPLIGTTDPTLPQKL